jgi:hypothetical protein
MQNHKPDLEDNGDQVKYIRFDGLSVKPMFMLKSLTIQLLSYGYMEITEVIDSE